MTLFYRVVLTLLAGVFAAPLFASPTAEMKTSLGTIVLELDEKQAPATVKNFVDYATRGFYDGTIFHRVIDGFMIQGGGFTKDMAQKPTGAPIQNESANGLRNDRGTISMARGNAAHSATSQFFINQQNNAGLNYPSKTPVEFGYAVFGKVVKGLDIVDKIAKTPTASRYPHENVPIEPVVIESVKIIRK